MSESSVDSGNLIRPTFLSGLAWLVFSLVTAGLLVLGVGSAMVGTELKVITIAWIACFVGSVLAYFGGVYPRGELNFAARLAIQMMVRTLIPFCVALWGIKFAKPPLETSLVFYILTFYLVGLIVEIQLQLGRMELSQSGKSVRHPEDRNLS